MSFLSRWLDEALSAWFLRQARPAERPRPDREELACYARDFLHEPARLYRFPDHPPTLAWSAVDALPWAGRQPFTFPSPFAPLYPAYARRYAGYGEDHTASGYLYRPSRPAQRAVLYLHGWMAPSFQLEERLLFPPLVQQDRLAILALALPFHMARRPAASAFSGEFFVGMDLTRSLEACRQAVAEARALLAWLRQEMPGPVGVVGVSLGALVASLLLGGGARPDFAILAMTPADVARTVMEAPLLRRVREDLDGDGLSPQERDSWARLVCPMALSPILPRERMLLIHGRDDAIAPAEGAQALWEAWGRPGIAWYNGGHFSILLRLRWVLSRCRGFVQKVSG